MIDSKFILIQQRVPELGQNIDQRRILCKVISKQCKITNSNLQAPSKNNWNLVGNSIA